MRRTLAGGHSTVICFTTWTRGCSPLCATFKDDRSSGGLRRRVGQCNGLPVFGIVFVAFLKFCRCTSTKVLNNWRTSWNTQRSAIRVSWFRNSASEPCIRRWQRAEIYFKPIAVDPEQIVVWDLPTRPTKQSDSRAKGFGALSVELDAIDPNRLRGLVEAAIERHLSARVLMAAEESERRAIAAFVGGEP
jgi:hypothetical protein